MSFGRCSSGICDVLYWKHHDKERYFSYKRDVFGPIVKQRKNSVGKSQGLGLNACITTKFDE